LNVVYYNSNNNANNFFPLADKVGDDGLHLQHQQEDSNYYLLFSFYNYGTKI